MPRKLSIIIPVFNERETVQELLRRVEQARLPEYWEKEIIVVDDGSDDGTKELLQNCTYRIRVILQEKNQGKGWSVQRGLQEATGDYCLIQDADLEYDTNEIGGLIHGLEQGKGDVIYGSRNLLKRRKLTELFIPRLGVWIITKLLNLLYGLSLTDAWTCYKLFPIGVAGDFPIGGFEAELLFTAALARRGLSIGEIPISHHPRSSSQGKKIRYRDGIWALLVLLGDWFSHQ
ncbi:MAG: glycosyltransferase family 2 protein [Candidatus Sungbacteria bacterium]|nr:glycosyltransferase family 2 protein [Candidatus Sungbacteria bacterium]